MFNVINVVNEMFVDVFTIVRHLLTKFENMKLPPHWVLLGR